MKWIILGLALFASTANSKAFDPRAFRGKQAGPPTQVLTLGSAHLAQLDGPVTPELLASVLDRLAAWKPDIITHEGISGEQCDLLERYRARFNNVWETYCWGTAEAQKATGLSVAQAMTAIETMLKDWPASPAFSARRRLATLFLAANDRPSAQVQWLSLPASERVAGTDVDASLLPILNRVGRKPNEAYDIGVALAVRLGHQRVYAVDDHTADSIQALAPAGFSETLNRIWSRPRPPEIAEFENRSARVTTAAAMLDFYRFLNTPKLGRALTENDHIAAMRDTISPQLGRQYFAWWETRNLRMVANVRAAIGNRPGARVLNIVGAAHKPYYDAYLGMMSDVTVVSASKVLK
jgi:Family of unknown function (DUF5694)